MRWGWIGYVCGHAVYVDTCGLAGLDSYTREAFNISRFIDLVHQEKKGLAFTVSIRSTITIFGFGASSSSMIQSNLGLSPSWLSHLEYNDGLASTYDIDLDICAKSSSPISDAFEEGASSTTAGNPSAIPPGRKGPENDAVINGGTVSSVPWVWAEDERETRPGADGLLFLLPGEVDDSATSTS